MWPPSSAEPPLSTWFARITIASAFQRISAARRCSIERSPGNGGCASSGMLLTYGVVIDGSQLTPVRRAGARSAPGGEQRVEDEGGGGGAVGGGQRVEGVAPLGRLGRVGVRRVGRQQRAEGAH